jgi:hypothetical protein
MKSVKLHLSCKSSAVISSALFSSSEPVTMLRHCSDGKVFVTGFFFGLASAVFFAGAFLLEAAVLRLALARLVVGAVGLS